MDKLKPLIVHHFWVLFGLAIILTFVGWWMTTGTLEEIATTRTDKLNSTFDGIPDGTNAPNDQWSGEVQKRNQVRAKRNAETHEQLWDRQQELIVWPPQIADTMADCPFRGRLAEATEVPLLYRSAYLLEIDRVWRMADPVGIAPRKGSVLFDEAIIPQVPQTKWDIEQPTWREIWDAQEDLWLVTELVKAVARVNEGAESVADAHVRQISEIKLFGATPEGGVPVVATTEATGEGEGSDYGSDCEYACECMMEYGMVCDCSFDCEEMCYMMCMGMMYMGPTGGAGRFGQRTQSTVNVDVDLAEEFEEPYVSSGTSTSGGGDLGAFPGFGAAPGGTSAGRRYIEDEGKPFRTRGFYIKAVVDHRRVPDLLVEITNSEWPLEIIRVHQKVRQMLTPGAPPGGLPGFGPLAGGYGAQGYGAQPGGGLTGGLAPGAIPGLNQLLNPNAGRGGMGCYMMCSMGMMCDMGGMCGMMGYMCGGGCGGGGGGVSGLGGLPEGTSSRTAQAIKAALEDQYLVDVVIVGVMMMYDPPTEAELALESTVQDFTSQTGAVAPDLSGGQADGTTAQPETGLPVDDGSASTTMPADAATEESSELTADDVFNDDPAGVSP